MLTAVMLMICCKDYEQVQPCWQIEAMIQMPSETKRHRPRLLPIFQQREAEPKAMLSSAFLYRYRNLVERFFNRLKHARGIATRYDKRVDNYLAAIKLFSVRIWIRHYESTA